MSAGDPVLELVGIAALLLICALGAHFMRDRKHGTDGTTENGTTSRRARR